MIVDNGPTMALIFLGLFLMVMTLFKTGCYFASSAVMIPLRTGVVRDIRIMVYAKVMRLPMSFFSEERKGDIIARMSGDVGEVENSITSSLDMLMKSPILIIIYLSLIHIYHFTHNSKGMYNPFSLLLAFDRNEFKSYWFETGTPVSYTHLNFQTMLLRKL